MAKLFEALLCISIYLKRYLLFLDYFPLKLLCFFSRKCMYVYTAIDLSLYIYIYLIIYIYRSIDLPNARG